MNKRCFSFLFLSTVIFLSATTVLAQTGPKAGERYSVVYSPSVSNLLRQSTSLTLYYVFDFWNTRYGTRLALWQNILRPDTTRLHSAQMHRSRESWVTTIDIPKEAALLSWIVSDGQYMDGNLEQTFVEYVLGDDGKPVKNARYFNIPFLKMAGKEIGTLVREMQLELADYPNNFPAYHQYFSLLIEQQKGSSRIQERIANQLEEMGKLYGDEDDFLNLVAQTWYYLLHDQKKGLEVRERIAQTRQWPQVLLMYDIESKKHESLERQKARRSKRAELIQSVLPDFNLDSQEGVRISFPTTDKKPLLLLFWAAASENSMMKIDEVKKLAEKYGSDINVFYVNVDPNREIALDIAEKRGITNKTLFNQGATLPMLGVDSLPTLIVTDSHNIIREIQVGFSMHQVAELTRLLPTLL